VGKYDALFRHLCNAGDDSLEMTFDEIELLVGPLPATASTRRTWWSNDPIHPSAHSRAWLDAGRQVSEVDTATRRATFSAARWRRSS
jgi:hypothetical protein